MLTWTEGGDPVHYNSTVSLVSWIVELADHTEHSVTTGVHYNQTHHLHMYVYQDCNAMISLVWGQCIVGACTQSKSRDVAEGRAHRHTHLSLVQMELTGKNAEQFLERVVVADAQNLPAGSCMLMPTYCLL